MWHIRIPSDSLSVFSAGQHTRISLPAHAVSCVALLFLSLRVVDKSSRTTVCESGSFAGRIQWRPGRHKALQAWEPGRESYHTVFSLDSIPPSPLSGRHVDSNDGNPGRTQRPAVIDPVSNSGWRQVNSKEMFTVLERNARRFFLSSFSTKCIENVAMPHIRSDSPVSMRKRQQPPEQQMSLNLTALIP